MNKFYQKTRLAAVIIFTVTVLVLYSAVLYRLQVYEAAFAQNPETLVPDTTVRVETLHAPRGDILDRNGRLLISSRPSYDIVLTRAALRRAPNTNEIIREVVHMTVGSGVAYIDEFPVTQGAPFNYVYNMTTQQRSRLDRYFEYHELDPEISASDFIIWLKEHYEIPYTMGITDTRLVIGVRYELEIRAIIGNIGPYIFAQNVPQEFVERITERAFPGVSVEHSSVREYHTEWAAHLLGYVNRMTSSQVELYSEYGYPLDAFVGQTGAEQAFELFLHGRDGERRVYTAENGAVISEEITREPVPGQNVYLSIDIDIQETAERALADYINTINLEREEGQRSTGGAIVAIDVRNSEILALASNPTFDAVTVRENIAALSTDPAEPLFNRATHGTYNPGSTFKPVTALAGLRTGVATRWSTVHCTGIYQRYNTETHGFFAPRCWIYNQVGFGHGSLNIVEAMRDSCNCYFYHLADNSGLDALVDATHSFGLGERTGIEISEVSGFIGTSEYKLRVTDGVPWYAADTVVAGIGQGYSRFTPVQIANFTATIANGGSLMDLSLLRSVKSADYMETVLEHEPVVRSVIPEQYYISLLQEGMRAAVTSGTARNEFIGYPVAVAAKTGTVQMSALDIDHGLFICYAPANDPEIAIAVVVEQGGSGAAIMGIARTVLDRYFQRDVTFGIVGEGSLIP